MRKMKRHGHSMSTMGFDGSQMIRTACICQSQKPSVLQRLRTEIARSNDALEAIGTALTVAVHQRQPDGKDAALAFSAFHRDRSPMQFDDPPGAGQADAAASKVHHVRTATKALEDEREIAGRNAHSRV